MAAVVVVIADSAGMPQVAVAAEDFVDMTRADADAVTEIAGNAADADPDPARRAKDYWHH